MPHISLADLAAARVVVTAPEAAALTLAVADLVAAHHLHLLPRDEDIVLSSTGQVSLERVTVSTGRHTAERVTLQLAALLQRLLRCAEPDGNATPGDEAVETLARWGLRAAAQDHDGPDLTALRAALSAHGAPEPAVLAGIFWRAARSRPLTGLAHSRRERAGVYDRRRGHIAASDLRRYLRDVERELYEARADASAPRRVSPPARRPRTRAGSLGLSLAATAAGAMIGAGAALAVAGAIGVSPLRDHGRPGAPAPAVDARRVQPRAPAVAPEAAIPTNRSVQPLLLAAAVGTDVFSPSFSPRGHTLLFHAGRKASPIMRASVTGGGTVRQIEKLIDDGAANYHVTMSPDGRLIAYDSDRDGVRGVYVAHADGSSPTRISGARYAAVPSWSPDGGRVAFVRAEADRPAVWNVWIADVHSGRLERITNHRIGQPWGASWFPDGRRIAYSLEDRLMIADLAAGMSRGYRSPRPGRLVRTPAVSPDGRRIVFQVQRDGVWLLDLERGRMRRILADATAEEFVWSPAGDAIAYHSRRGGAYGLWRLALESPSES